MKTRSLLVAAVSVLAFTLTARGSDWPQWRGPQRDGVSKETGLLKEWPKEGPKLLWQVKDAGDGYSTPAVVGERFYLISNKGPDNEFVEARAVKDGKSLWTTTLGKVGPNTKMASYPGSRSTPTVDGELLYALGSDGDLVCAKAADGSVVWRKNLRTDFGGKPGLWAYAESPLIDGDTLVCTPGGKEATLIALDKKKGGVLWKAAVPTGDTAGYASAIIVEVGGVKQYVQFMQYGLVGVEAKSGKLLWTYGKTAAGSLANIPTPVAKGGYVYSGAGKSGGGLVKITVDNEKVSAEQVYFKVNLPTSIGGSVLLSEYLYGTNNKGLICAEFMTSKEKWQEKGIGAASICYADGRLYLHGENGEVALIEATPDAYREKGRFTPPNGPDRGRSKAWAYPVVANGRLYLRDLGAIWCYDVADPQARK